MERAAHAAAAGAYISDRGPWPHRATAAIGVWGKQGKTKHIGLRQLH